MKHLLYNSAFRFIKFFLTMFLLILSAQIIQTFSQQISEGDRAGTIAKEYFSNLSFNNGSNIGDGPEAITDKIFTGAAADDQFGFSVSTAGDVNGDGYSDVIVGAKWNDGGGTNAGRAYIYFGGNRCINTMQM